MAAAAQELVDDLAAGQVADQSQGAGGAERTAHGAAGLGADAERVAAPAGQQDGLDRRAVGGAKEELVGAVFGLLDRPGK